MGRGKTAVVAAVALVAPALHASAVEFAVTMAELTRAPAMYVGQQVILADCFMITVTTILGAQCSVDPIDADVIVWVDSDTWGPNVAKLTDSCSTADPTRMCTLKVTGTVSLNRHFQAVIEHATVEVVKRPRSI